MNSDRIAVLTRKIRGRPSCMWVFTYHTSGQEMLLVFLSPIKSKRMSGLQMICSVLLCLTRIPGCNQTLYESYMMFYIVMIFLILETYEEQRFSKTWSKIQLFFLSTYLPFVFYNSLHYYNMCNSVIIILTSGDALSLTFFC